MVILSFFDIFLNNILLKDFFCCVSEANSKNSLNKLCFTFFLSFFFFSVWNRENVLIYIELSTVFSFRENVFFSLYCFSEPKKKNKMKKKTKMSKTRKRSVKDKCGIIVIKFVVISISFYCPMYQNL